MQFKPVGLRLPVDLLKALGEIEEEQSLDRSTVARQLIFRGLKGYRRDKAVLAYKSGKMAMSEASKLADMSIGEFEACLVREGYKSNYSLDDLQSELKILSTA